MIEMTFFDTLCEKFEAHRPVEIFEAFVDFTFSVIRKGCGGNEPIKVLRGNKGEEESEKAFYAALFDLSELMTKYPFSDVLGELHMKLGSKQGKQFLGEFYTPEHVAELMAAITISDLQERVRNGTKPVKIAEPACGSGRMFLAIVKKNADFRGNMRCYGTDMNLLAVKMCYINLTLNSIPAVIDHGNTLTQEIWATYSNIPFVLFIRKEEKKQWKRRRTFTTPS